MKTWWFCIGFGIYLIGTLLGCQSLPPKAQMGQDNLLPHYVVIDRDGFARGPDHEKFSTAALETHLRNTMFRELTLAAERIQNCSPKPSCSTPLKVLVFVHGGMNGYDDDFERMRRLMEQDEGTQLPGLLSPSRTNYFPIFINWNSEPVNATIDDLFNIRFAHRQPLWLTIPTAPFVMLSRVLKSVANVPVSLLHIGYNVKEAFAGAIEAGDSHVCAIADSLAYGTLLPFYTVTTPLLEGFGTPAWDIMKRRAELTVATRLPEDTEHAREGAARTLVRMLMQHGFQLPVKMEVTLVGHSMGSIILNRLLPLINANANSFVRHIIYLAPAANLEDVNDYVIPYLHGHDETDFSSFMLNRRDEAREIAKGGWVWFLPRGSLLAWIDTFFETTTTLHEETAGRITNINSFFACDWQDRQSAGTCADMASLLTEGQPATQFGYRERVMKATSPFPPGRVHLYEAVRPLDKQSAAQEHGDFTQSRYLGHVLCRVNQGAFEDQLCTTTLSRYSPIEDTRPRVCGIPMGLR